MKRSERRDKTLNAKLFVRILPSTDFHYDSIKIETNKKVLYVRCLQDLTKGVNGKNPNYWYFCSDGVFWNACQSEVYETVTSGLYEDLFDGVRGIILCYGQTGSGKTFTTSGLRFSFESRGLILRILSQLFEEVEARCVTTRVRLGMSYLEFLGQNVKDLIGNKKVNNIRDVTEYPIPDESWAWRELFKAETRKSFTESAPYKGSNKGHSVLTYYIHTESLIDSDPVISHSKIYIVDMAGIDSLGNKSSEFRSKTDLGNSNVSKSLMEQLILCLTGVAWKNENHVCPYKSSRFLSYLHDTLTQKCLLRFAYNTTLESLSNNNKAVNRCSLVSKQGSTTLVPPDVKGLRFVAHIHGNLENLPLTISTLKFGEKIRAFRPTKLERIYQTNRELQIKTLEREYLRLKDEAELFGMLRNYPDYSNVSQERLQQIKRAAEAFLFGQLEDLTLFSLGQATLTLEVFREMYEKLSSEKEQMVKDAIAAATEMMQMQPAPEKSTASNTNVIPATQKVSRRKSSRQAESQMSFGVSNRSSDSTPNVGKVSSVVHQAGVTDRKGIGVGPGRTSTSFEGNITKAFKKLRSRKSESIVVRGVKSSTTKDLGILSSKNPIQEESEISLSNGIPSRDSAWQQFLNENTELADELRNKVEIAQEKVKETKRKYTATFANLGKIREEIEESRLELENYQHIREIYGKDGNEEEGNLAKEIEKNLADATVQREQLMNEAIENCHVALIDFRDAVEEMNDSKKALEEAFQEFCKEHYKLVFPTENLNLSELKTGESQEKSLTEGELRDNARMSLYTQLRNDLNTAKLLKHRKKTWINRF